MDKQLSTLMTSIRVNNKPFNLKEQSKLIGVNINICSVYIRSIQCIVQGENDNPRTESRNAVLTITDLVLGETISILYLEAVLKKNFY